jgi:hypothetical protein
VSWVMRGCWLPGLVGVTGDVMDGRWCGCESRMGKGKEGGTGRFYWRLALMFRVVGWCFVLGSDCLVVSMMRLLKHFKHWKGPQFAAVKVQIYSWSRVEDRLCLHLTILP